MKKIKNIRDRNKYGIISSNIRLIGTLLLKWNKFIYVLKTFCYFSVVQVHILSVQRDILFSKHYLL